MNQRDSRATQIILGSIVPATIAAYLLICLYSGSILCPQGGHGIKQWQLVWAGDAMRFWFWWPAHAALAIALTSWFGLGNSDSLGRFMELGLLLALGVFAAGLVAAVVIALV